MYTNQNAADKYNARMSLWGVQNAYKQIESFANMFYRDTRDRWQFMNVCIDAAMELCGDRFFCGASVKLACWLQDSEILQSGVETWLWAFRLP